MLNLNKKIKIFQKKKNKTKIVSLTAYSKNIAKILDKYCDIILVGDSLANVLYGLNNTHKINLENMIQHTLSVKKGIKKSLLVVDMPKGSYRNLNLAKKNAKLLIRKTKCDAIKIESNKKNFKIIRSLVKHKIPVMGHIGFTPQFKKFKVQGDTKNEANKLLRSEKYREGRTFNCFECVNPTTSKLITNSLKIPTIGIGSSVIAMVRYL